MDLLLADSFLVYKKGYIADLVFGKLKKKQQKKKKGRFGLASKERCTWGGVLAIHACWIFFGLVHRDRKIKASQINLLIKK